MSDDPHDQARTLRAEFDAAFARRSAASIETVALLAIRIGVEPFAVRLLEAGGLVPLRQVVAVPTRRPEVLGVAGLRGEVIPVYGLARLVLRRPDDPPRWMILAGSGERVGLAFTSFDGHLVVPAGEIHPAPGDPSAAHVAALYAGAPQRPVLDLAALVTAATAH